MLDKAKNYTVSEGSKTIADKVVPFSDSATNSMLTQLKSAIAEGATYDDLLEDLGVYQDDGTAELRNYDNEFLTNWLNAQKAVANSKVDGLTKSSFKQW